MKRNTHLARLKGNYLFPEIGERTRQFLKQNPNAQLISLGVGDTSEPIAPCVAEALQRASSTLATRKGYTGYGPEQGSPLLREKIATTLYSNRVDVEEVFISDGAKCDLGRLQTLFGNKISIAVQDPAYPVYIEGSLIMGVEEIVSMPCLPENHFFPDLERVPRTDLIYFCSPNNPTGAAATRSQLEQLVHFAQSNGSILIFDSAYASYIQDPTLPRSIFEIEGAKTVAIEIGSFSKLAGFSGVRLGWSVVPEALCYEDGTSVHKDWKRLTSTLFNGASNLAQAGGCAALEPRGLEEITSTTHYYLENAKLLYSTLKHAGYEVFGAVNAPYLWLRFPGANSWEIFHHFLNRFQIVVTPGSGFGPGGEGFIRLTAFGHREKMIAAAARLRETRWNT